MAFGPTATNRFKSLWAQQRSFAWVDLADYYAPLQREKDSNRVSKGENKVSGNPTLAGFRCCLSNSKEVSLPMPIGRGNLSNFRLADYLRTDIDVEMVDGGYIQIKTPGHPLFNQWFIVQADAEVLPLLADAKIFRIKESPKGPPGFTG